MKRAPEEPEGRSAYLRSQLFKEERRLFKDWDKIAVIIEEQAKIGKIGPVEEKYVGVAVKRGAELKIILERRPDLTRSVIEKTNPEKIIEIREMQPGISDQEITRQLIEEQMDKIEPETFRKKVQTEALKNSAVVYNILKDEARFSEMEKRAKAEAKKEIKRTLEENPYPVAPEDEPLIIERVRRILEHPR